MGTARLGVWLKLVVVVEVVVIPDGKVDLSFIAYFGRRGARRGMSFIVFIIVDKARSLVGFCGRRWLSILLGVRPSRTSLSCNLWSSGHTSR